MFLDVLYTLASCIAAPGYWPAYYPTCTGNGQSPIDIPAFTDVKMAQYDPELNLNTLEYHGHTQWLTGTIKNNGHTSQYY